MDFVLTIHPNNPTIIECKWSASDFDATSIKSFRKQYPEGDNFVVVTDISRTFSRTYDNVSVRFVRLRDLIDAIA